MNQQPSEPCLFAAWTERPLAYIAAGLAITTLLWKTMGLGFVPGWDEMFGGVGSQYPRRPEALTAGWSLAYGLVYGILGSAATVSGVLISRRRRGLLEPAGPGIARLAKIMGLFHVTIGLHHTAWAATGGRWGHLSLEQFDVPGLYVVGGIAGLGAGLHGLRLLTTKGAHLTHRVVRSKIAVDGVSLLTFTSVFVCFPLNLMGMERSALLERISWVVVFVGPAIWLGCDLLRNRRL